jgi:hypothetical protein
MYWHANNFAGFSGCTQTNTPQVDPFYISNSCINFINRSILLALNIIEEVKIIYKSSHIIVLGLKEGYFCKLFPFPMILFHVLA